MTCLSYAIAFRRRRMGAYILKSCDSLLLYSTNAPSLLIAPFVHFLASPLSYRLVRQCLTYFLIDADPRQRQLKRARFRHCLGSGDGQCEPSCCGKTRSKTLAYTVANILLRRSMTDSFRYRGIRFRVLSKRIVSTVLSFGNLYLSDILSPTRDIFYLASSFITQLPPFYA
jgi:hypothetical protein